MKLIFLCSSFLIFGCFCEVAGWRRSNRKDCIIPRGVLYDRATFRLQYGYETRPLGRGEKVAQYMGVVAVCDKDILTDLVTKYHVLTCHRGKWKPRLPRCEAPINCAQLHPVANTISEVLLGNDVNNPHGTVMRYRCKEGYTLNGHDERHCKNGVWDDIKFNCTRKLEGPKKCKKSSLNPVENAILVLPPATNTEYPHGTEMSYRCAKGYKLIGENTITCLNGTWDVVKFHCQRNDAFLDAIFNTGAILCFANVANTGFHLDKHYDCIIPRGDLYDRATFRLQHGYDIRPLGRGENVAQSKGVVVVCDKDILDDLVTEYHKLTCQRGRWKPKLPKCEGPTNCAQPQPVANTTSEVLLGNDVDYPHGTVMRYRCKEGYTLNGHDERHCKNGVWDDIKFNCTRKLEVFCKLPRKGNRYFTYQGSGRPVVTSKVANRVKVVQHCRTGLRKSASSCIDGRWRPAFQYCPHRKPVFGQGRILVANCTLPDNPMALYIDSTSNYVDVTEEIPQDVEVMQVCGKGGGDTVFDESKSSYCHGGRWIPEFENCISNIPPLTVCEESKLSIERTDVNLPDRSHVDALNVGLVDSIEECAKFCVNSTDFYCKSIQVYQFGNDDATIELFCILLSEVANNDSERFIKNDGVKANIYNIKCGFDTNSTGAMETAVCTRPDIAFATLSPDLEEYYLREVVTVHCHTKTGSINENITCQTTGEWSRFNITCEAYEHDLHCHPQEKSHMVYWPIKKFYDLNDTLKILTCGEGLVPAGSSEIKCTANETWEGDFECLSPCENGDPVILATNFHYPRLKEMSVKDIGYLKSPRECARFCVEHANFTCNSIQVYIVHRKGRVYNFCKLLSETAYKGSKKFVERRNKGSVIYNVQCDTSCQLPAEYETKFSVTAVSGERLKTDDMLPNGTILRINCIGTLGEYKKQQTVTCLAGKWSAAICA